MGSYKGKTCPYCQFPLKADSEVVVCAECRTPHHRECWAENGGCTTFGCRETTYQSAAADRLEIYFDEASGRETAPVRGGGNNKLLVAALVITLLAFTGVVFAYINLLSDWSAALPGDTVDVSPETYAPAVIAALDADYYIDYENGTIPIGELPIGTRVVDPSWVWEFRTGDNYSGSGAVKPITWIVVAKDHYDNLEPHVTLLSEELIGKHVFDNSSNQSTGSGSNHWGDSGTADASRGLRPWLNSTGIHSSEGFYRALSESFKEALFATTVPNKEWKNGTAYSTRDHIFIPSTTELGDSAHEHTYRIGTAYPYFSGEGNVKRVARLGGETWEYWIRSPFSPPFSLYGYVVRIVDRVGEFYYSDGLSIYFYAANLSDVGVRPALNLKSETLASEIRN